MDRPPTHPGLTRARRQAERDLAASAQEAFSRTVVALIARGIVAGAGPAAAAAGSGFSSAARPEDPAAAGALARRVLGAEGIALGGGGALNVLLNQRIRDVFGLPVWVPSAPADDGLAVGLAWTVQPPPRPPTGTERSGARLGLEYAGASLWDARGLPELARRAEASRTSTEGLAERLAAGAVVGAVVGRQEFGPRALGHRSLLAVPGPGMKARMNAVKAREWWRPVAPTLLASEASAVFEGVGELQGVGEGGRQGDVSPFMSFAPRLRPEMRTRAPAVWHFDGTARPQTVTAEREPWLHALLTAVKRETGLGVLINTSFNTRGQPMVNRAEDAVCLLCQLHGDGLDHVWIDGWLFSQDRGQACRACSAEGMARISESVMWP
jgi:carbamoyltransferase